jgi:hypothetical protein
MVSQDIGMRHQQHILKNVQANIPMFAEKQRKMNFFFLPLFLSGASID